MLSTLEPPLQSTTQLHIASGCASRQGICRPRYEDCLYVDPDNSLFIVADGISGEAGAREASQLAVTELTRSIHEWVPLLGVLTGDDHSLDGAGEYVADDFSPSAPSRREVIEQRIRQTFEDVNQMLLSVRDQELQLCHMGTTAALAMLHDTRLWFGWLGDSRIYLIRDGKGLQLTVDHGLARAMADAGLISKEAVSRHPYRNTLWKYLGCDSLGDGADVDSLQLFDGDRIVLLTDGITNRVGDTAIAQIVVESQDPDEACESLVDAALGNHSTDDLSVVTVFVDGDESIAR